MDGVDLKSDRRRPAIDFRTCHAQPQSTRCPGAISRDDGRQRPSAATWILVVGPPRERPRPPPAAPPPPAGAAERCAREGELISVVPLSKSQRGGRWALGCSGGTLVGPHRGRVDIHLPVDAALRIDLGLDVLAHLPGAVRRPRRVPLMDPLPGVEAFRWLAPALSR